MTNTVFLLWNDNSNSIDWFTINLNDYPDQIIVESLEDNAINNLTENSKINHEILPSVYLKEYFLHHKNGKQIDEYIYIDQRLKANNSSMGNKYVDGNGNLLSRTRLLGWTKLPHIQAKLNKRKIN